MVPRRSLPGARSEIRSTPQETSRSPRGDLPSFGDESPPLARPGSLGICRRWGTGAEVLMIAAAVGWITIYSHLIHPGEAVPFYQNYPLRAAPWVSLILRVPIFFVVCRWIGRRSPGRAWLTGDGGFRGLISSRCPARAARRQSAPAVVVPAAELPREIPRLSRRWEEWDRAGILPPRRRAFRRRFGRAPREYREWVRADPAGGRAAEPSLQAEPIPASELSATRVIRLRPLQLAFRRLVGPYEDVPESLFDELEAWAIRRLLPGHGCGWEWDTMRPGRRHRTSSASTPHSSSPDHSPRTERSHISTSREAISR